MIKTLCHVKAAKVHTLRARSKLHQRTAHRQTSARRFGKVPVGLLSVDNKTLAAVLLGKHKHPYGAHALTLSKLNQPSFQQRTQEA